MLNISNASNLSIVWKVIASYSQYPISMCTFPIKKLASCTNEGEGIKVGLRNYNNIQEIEQVGVTIKNMEIISCDYRNSGEKRLTLIYFTYLKYAFMYKCFLHGIISMK